MHAYEARRFDPPAPMALVTLKLNQLSIVIRDVPILLDTGADISLLPRPLVAHLVSADAKQYELEAFDGTKSMADSIIAELMLVGKTFRGQFLLVDTWHGVLGRNILNNLCLLFDGPSSTWTEQRLI